MSRKTKQRRWPGGVRWGHLWEIDRRCNIGTSAWYARHPETRLQKLTAWRNLHRLRQHSTISKKGRSFGKNPSSNMTLPQMIKTGKKYESYDQGIR